MWVSNVTILWVFFNRIIRSPTFLIGTMMVGEGLLYIFKRARGDGEPIFFLFAGPL